MLLSLYIQILVLSLVTSGLYLILKGISRLTMKYFHAVWHYRTYLIIFSFFIIPYHYFLSLCSFGWVQEIKRKVETVPGMGFASFEKAGTLPLMDYVPEQQRNDWSVAVINVTPFFLLSGTVIFLLLLIAHNWKLHYQLIKRCGIATDLKYNKILHSCKEELGIKRNLTVYISEAKTSPFLYGILKPRIVLPDIEFTDKELHYTFMHELTHWKRRDTMIKGILLLINAIHWYNPLAYILRKDIDRYCEFSCDERVVASLNKQERRDYCELILSVLCNGVSESVLSAFSSKRKHLERRIDLIIDDKNIDKGYSRRTFAFVITLTLALLGTVTAYAANYQRPIADGKQFRTKASALNVPDLLQPPYSDNNYLSELLEYDKELHIYRYDGKWVRMIDDRYMWNSQFAGGVKIMQSGESDNWGKPVDIKVVRNEKTNRIEGLIEMTDGQRLEAESSISE